MGYFHYNFWFYVNCIFIILFCASQCDIYTSEECVQVTDYPNFYRFEGSCFWVSHWTDRRSWDNAQEMCDLLGGNLATVVRLETAELLKKYWPGEVDDTSNYWIGLYLDATNANHHKRRQDIWKWLDGTRFDPLHGVGWHTDEPGLDEITGMLKNLKWATFKTSMIARFPYICELKLPINNTKTSDSPEPTTVSELPINNTKTSDSPEPTTVSAIGYIAIGAALGIFAMLVAVGANFGIRRYRGNKGCPLMKCTKKSSPSEQEDGTEHYCEIAERESTSKSDENTYCNMHVDRNGHHVAGRESLHPGQPHSVDSNEVYENWEMQSIELTDASGPKQGLGQPPEHVYMGLC